eukprot:1161592-Pelagomonas_calceolata.AAC.19
MQPGFQPVASHLQAPSKKHPKGHSCHDGWPVTKSICGLYMWQTSSAKDHPSQPSMLPAVLECQIVIDVACFARERPPGVLRCQIIIDVTCCAREMPPSVLKWQSHRHCHLRYSGTSTHAPAQTSTMSPGVLPHVLRYQHLTHGEAPAVRAGCLVVSFGASPFETPDHSLSLQEMRQHTADTAK